MRLKANRLLLFFEVRKNILPYNENQTKKGGMFYAIFNNCIGNPMRYDRSDRRN